MQKKKKNVSIGGFIKWRKTKTCSRSNNRAAVRIDLGKKMATKCQSLTQERPLFVSCFLT